MKWVDLTAGSIAVRDTAEDAPAIVFVHGLLANGRLWDATADALGAGYRRVIPDLPLGAHPRAMRPDADLSPIGLASLVAELLERLDLRDVVLVGNDTGGAVCQLVVTGHPERIGRLVLTNCDAYENFLPPFFRPLQWIGKIPGAAWTSAQLFRATSLQRAFVRTVAHTRLDRNVLRSFARPFIDDPEVRRDAVKVLRTIDKRHTIEAARDFAGFRRPVLIAWGRDDRFFKAVYAERLANDFPDAHLEWIERSKTFVPIDKPAELAGAIRKFLGRA